MANEGKKKLEDINAELGRFESSILDIANTLSSKIKEAIADIRDEAAGVDEIFRKNLVKGINDLARGSDTFLKNTQKIYNGTARVKDIQKDLNDLQSKRLGIQRNLEILNARGLLKDNEKREALKELNKAYTSQNIILQEQLKLTNEIERKIGVAGSLLKGIAEIPILGKLVDSKKILEDMASAAGKGASSFQTMGVGIASLGKSIFSNLISVGSLVNLFKSLINLGFKTDTQITNISKTLVGSKKEAEALRNQFKAVRDSSGLDEGAVKTIENQAQALSEIATTLGTSRGITQQMINDQIMLTKQVGLTGEEAGGLQSLMATTGKTADDIIDSVIGQTTSLVKQKGIQLDNKKILGEVAKVSGQLRLQYRNNPELIAKAVVQANKLGLTLEQAANASKKLLNFEESIEAELAAELITGKDLNLERARLLALNGDVAGSMEELLSQISLEEFQNMNVLQQEAIAKALGMQTDELANSLVQQKQLSNLGGTFKKEIEDKIKLLEKEDRIAEANALRKSIGNEEEAKAALKRIDDQTKFNNIIENLKERIASIAEGPMKELVNKMVAFVSNEENIKMITETIKDLGKGMMIAVGFAKDLYHMFQNIKQATVDLLGEEGASMLGKIAGVAAVGTLIASVVSSRLLGTNPLTPMYVRVVGGGGIGGDIIDNIGDGNTSGRGSKPKGKGGIFKGGLGRLSEAFKGGGMKGAAKSAGRIISKGAKANALTALIMGGIEAGSSISEGKGVGESLGRTAITGLTSLLGGIGGSLILGPGFGTVGGGIAGGLAGDKLGDMIFGEEVEDAVINSNGLIAASYKKGMITPIAQGAPDDNIIFTTNKPQQKETNQQPLGSMINIDALIRETQRTNALLERYLNKDIIVRHDSDVAGKNANINTYGIA